MLGGIRSMEPYTCEELKTAEATYIASLKMRI